MNNPRKASQKEISDKDPCLGFDGANEIFLFHSDVLCQQHLPALMPLDQQDAMSDLKRIGDLHPSDTGTHKRSNASVSAAAISGASRPSI